MSRKKILTYVILTITIFLVIKVYYDSSRPSEPPIPEAPPEAVEEKTVPRFPIGYALGTFDSRFGIDENRFLHIVAQAKRVWENAAGRDLFQYRPDAFFKINLIFDLRQERLLEAKKQMAKVDESGKSFDQLRREYEGKSRSVEQGQRVYDEAVQAYKNRLAEYSARVERWNAGENHTEPEYQYLQDRKKELDAEGREVEAKRIEQNKSLEEINRLGESVSALAKKYNLEAENFNGAFVVKREFEKGIYDGKGINIYEFEKEEDLKLALVHEFGHALRLEHVENPRAIMYRMMGAQDMYDIRLTSEELNLLLAKLR